VEPPAGWVSRARWHWPLQACPAPDILITNAGGPASTDFRSLTLQDWRGALDANFLSATELIRSVADGMIQRRFDHIVNITSLTVRMPVQRLELSNATRLALTGYVASVARQLGAHLLGILPTYFLPVLPMTLRELRPTQNLAQAHPELRLERTDGQIAPITGAIQTVAGDSSIQQASARPRRRFESLCIRQWQHIVRQQRRRHRDIHMTSTAGAPRVQ
jgi:NAD(P)-dependent dehydrogenase (short-subunit alcohol dehydrogenase family)